MVLEQKHRGLLFRIESEEFLEQVKKETVTGFYLYIYQGDICEYDYLQDTVSACKEIAFEEFGTPMEGWEELAKK